MADTDAPEEPGIPDAVFAPTVTDAPPEPFAEQPDVVDEPEAPEPSTPIAPQASSAEAELRRERDELRMYLARMEGELRARQAPPTATPDPFANVPHDQRAAWNESLRVLDPYLAQRDQQRDRAWQQQMAAVQAQTREAQTWAERAALRQKYAGFAEHEDDLVRARDQEFHRTGQWWPLELAYQVAVGARVLNEPSPRQQKTQQRRQGAARAALPVNQPPQSTRVPTPSKSVDQIAAMSDEDILNQAAEKAGIPRLRLQRRA